MEYFEKDKTYNFEEIQEIYKNASARAIEKFSKMVDSTDSKDPMFDLMLTVTAMEIMGNMYSIMFAEKNKKDKEN